MKIAIVRYVDGHDLQSYPMLGLGYIKAYVDQHIPRTFDFVYLECGEDYSTLDCWDADLYAFTALSQDYTQVVELANFVRTRTDSPIVLGGSHISFYPKSLHPAFLCGVLGDGEPTFLEICNRLHKGDLTRLRLSEIPGLIFHGEDGQIRFSPPSRGIEHLDDLPIPDRKFGAEGLKPHLLSSRGCPFTCSFCTSSEYWKKFRAFSADYIKAEILSVIEAFPDEDFLPFWDDLFIANRRRFQSVVEMLERTRLNQILAFSCGVRVDLVDAELCELLKRGNFRAVFFGLESGSDRVLRWLKGGKATVETMQRALNVLHEYEITVAAPFIVGIPSETKEDLRMTYDFVLRNMEDGKLHEAQSHVMCPMPGTQIWRDSLKNGLVSESADFNWGRLRYYSGWRNYQIDPTSGHADFATWVQARKNNNSIYIGDQYSEEYLYETMEPYEQEIDSMGLKLTAHGAV